MFLNKLKAENFRNYSSLDLGFSPDINIFFGRNAQGKTNLLEAISLLALGRSFRTKKEEELIRWDTEHCYTVGEFLGSELDTRIEIGIGRGEKKVKIDCKPVRRNELLGRVPIVFFGPDDLQLVKGGPAGRREFIDLYLAQIEPEYRLIYYNFYKVLQQRNRLLKEIHPDRNELEAWNEQLIDRGTQVILYRMRLVEQIKPFINQAHHQISASTESLNIEYLTFRRRLQRSATLSDVVEWENLMDREMIEGIFRSEIERMGRVEMERHITLVGPQLDDLRLTLGSDIELRDFGSQGQQRTASLALKLGLIAKIKENRGEFPLLLLDDVMSEFDDCRKQALLQNMVGSVQTFMTSTSRRDFPIPTDQARFFEVEQGAVKNVQ